MMVDYPAATEGQVKLQPETSIAPQAEVLTPGQTGLAESLGLAFGLAADVSAGVLAWHGYKRTKSVPWAILWGMSAFAFPVMIPIAIIQGLGKPKKKKKRGRRRRR